MSAVLTLYLIAGRAFYGFDGIVDVRLIGPGAESDWLAVRVEKAAG
jgi:hypothetical protein